MADASPLLRPHPPPGGKPPPAASRFARCSSHAHDELRSFRACLAWLCVDHSPSRGLAAAGSWAVFLLLAVAGPAAARLLHAPPRPYDGQVQVSLTLAASLAYVSLRAVLRRSGGLRRLLYLDSLRRDSEDVQAGYAAQLARSFRVLACFVLPCALAEAAYKAYWYWYYAAAGLPALGSPWWAAAACALEVASWVYRVALFFMVCVLFRVICYLQILRMVGFAREFGRFADVATVLQHHRRIREQLRKISHRYRKFIVCSLILVSASQFAALLSTTRPHAVVNLATAGDLAKKSLHAPKGTRMFRHHRRSCLPRKQHTCSDRHHRRSSESISRHHTLSVVYPNSTWSTATAGGCAGRSAQQVCRQMRNYRNFLHSGTLCSLSLVAGLLVCLHSAAKITHKTQAMTSVAAAWHADATVLAFDNDQEDPDPDLPPTAGYLAPANAYRVAAGDESGSDDDDSHSETSSLDDPKYVPFQTNNICFQKRQALVTYLENNRAGITVYGFVVDRAWLHALFMIEFSLVMWLLGKTVGIS
ncbi:hypothetical protein GQ55_1G269700 [Panicum hallii var. hallii]|uniref:Uncharacterized protein n=1 Tax=Panicum hallii var. hallii TaxID=1504633 RepID=A0A2T7F7Y4_9POAL|nr:hypothetical protein GQ55_1G269700 [Panicum hallii var. hallii]